jgi:hypothetical protein
LTIDNLDYDSRYGFRGIPFLFLRLPFDICRQIYFFYRQIVERYNLNEIYLDDIVEFLLQRMVLLVVFRVFEISNLVCILIPVYIYNRSKPLRPILKLLVLIGTVIGVVMFLVALFYLLAFFKIFAWTVLSLLARE